MEDGFALPKRYSIVTGFLVAAPLEADPTPSLELVP